MTEEEVQAAERAELEHTEMEMRAHMAWTALSDLDKARVRVMRKWNWSGEKQVSASM